MFDQTAIQELKHADDNRAMSEALQAAFDRKQIALAIPDGYTLTPWRTATRCASDPVA